MKRKIKIQILDKVVPEKEMKTLYEKMEAKINRYINGAEDVIEDLYKRMSGEIVIFTIEGIQHCVRVKKTTTSYSNTILRTIDVKLIYTKK